MRKENNLNLREEDHRPQVHIVITEDQGLLHTRDHNPEIDTKIVMIDTDQSRENVIRIPEEADTVEVDQVNLRLIPDQTLLEAQITSQIQDLKQS